MKSSLIIKTALLTLILSACEITLPSLPSSQTSEDVTTSETTTSASTDSSEISVSTSSSTSTTSVPTTSSSQVTTSTSSSTSADPGLGYILNDAPTITMDGYRAASDSFGMPTTGVAKLLVIPVTFTDYRCGVNCVTRKEQIRKTFFGAKEETSWHSVKSFYETSSYGKLTLEGVVTDWYDSNWSTSTFASLTGSGTYASYYDPTWSMLDSAIAWYKTQTGSNLTEYDTDNDGFIDAVYLVYNNPNATKANYTAAGEEVYWAYTYWNYNNYASANVNNPVGMTLVWSSFDFMFEGYGTSGIDAHTYIHEMGHAFSLDDYYSYTSGDWGAAGGVDMMDYNIVDHNAFSKYLLGWTNPYVLNSAQTTTTITLNPFESSGDFFLLGNNWNGSAFDEYLIFEFYTPTGINEKDSLAAYPGNGLRGFTVPGVKIYHVDARLGRYSNSNNTFGGYTDTLNNGTSFYPYLAHSNSSEYSQNVNFKLLHLLEAGGSNTFINGATATNNTLFKQGNTFNPTSTHSSFFYYSGGRFNDQSLIGYSVQISSVTNQQATLVVTKI
jgi:M6 family metalloprotease-like protein